MPRRYLIVGMGVAGIAAAEAIRSQDAAGEITLLTQDARGYYSLPGLAYFINQEIPEEDLFPFSDKDFKRLNLHAYHSPVLHLDLANHRLILAGGKSMDYDRLLLAMGSQAVCPDLPGYRLPEVVTLDSMEDAHRILKLCKKVRSAVVVGGGITALEIVEGLACHGLQVHYFMRGDRYWANVLDEDESRIVEKRLQEDKVVIHYNTELAEIQGKKGHVSAVVTRKGELLSCGMVAIAIGVMPRKELAAEAGIHVDRGILVDEHMHTDQPDVYAAGDVAQVYDPYTGKYMLDTLWGLARQQGHAAGMNMAGKETSYLKTISTNVTRLVSLHTTIIGSVGHGRDADLVGIARGDSEAWREQLDAPSAESDQDINHIRLLVGEKSLVGALIMGDQSLTQAIKWLISEKVDITPIREALLIPGAAIAEIISTFWSAWSKEHETWRA